MLAHKLIFKWLYLQLKELPLSPLGASLFITIIAFPCHGSYRFGLFNPRFNIEVAIQKMIEASQRMLDVQSQVLQALKKLQRQL
jgi:hypothetical protein